VEPYPSVGEGTLVQYALLLLGPPCNLLPFGIQRRARLLSQREHLSVQAPGNLEICHGIVVYLHTSVGGDYCVACGRVSFECGKAFQFAAPRMVVSAFGGAGGARATGAKGAWAYPGEIVDACHVLAVGGDALHQQVQRFLDLACLLVEARQVAGGQAMRAIARRTSHASDARERAKEGVTWFQESWNQGFGVEG